MPRSYRGTYYDSSDEEYPAGIVINATRSRHGSPRGRRRDDEVYVAESLLAVPEAGRHHRSASTGAAPQPQFVNVMVQDRSPERGHSHERRRDWGSGSATSEEEIRYREHQRRASKRKSDLDEELILKLDKLRSLEHEKEERERKELLKREVEREKIREAYEREQKEKKEKEMQREYVEKWKREEAEKREKARREKEEEDARFEARFKIQFMQAGYTEEQAEAVLKKKKIEKEKKHQNTLAIDLSRPTWIKVKRKWLLPETLDHYYLPWEWDKDPEYIVIKQYVDQETQDRLFDHTRMLKERKMIAGPIEKDVVTTLKVRDKSKDQMYLVRKKSKSPGRKIFVV